MSDSPAPSILRRVRTPEGWYADVPHRVVPLGATAFSLTVLAPDDPPPSAAVVLRGTVLQAEATTSVVSCGGLRARVAPGLVEGSEVRLALEAR